MYVVSSISLKNIKSHKDTSVEFSKGVNLIIGDVGAGKSTILEAIEAGLLGFRVRELLRVGEREGEIGVALEPGLEVRRRIRRKGSGEVFVTLEDGRRYTFTTTQARELVVKKLRLMEQTNPNAEPLVTRAAIYVRQEEMKRILDEPERAAEVVKRATGILKFSIARENSLLLGDVFEEKEKSLRDRIDEISKEVERRGEIEKGLKEAEKELKEIDEKLSGLEEELRTLKDEKKRLDEERIRLQGLTGEAKSLSDSINELERQVSEKEELVASLREEVEKEDYLLLSEGELESLRAEAKALKLEWEKLLEKRAEERTLRQDVEELKERLEGVDFGALSKMDELKKEEEDLTKRLSGLTARIALLEAETKNYEKLVESGRCWVCGQEVNVNNYRRHLEEIEVELERLRKEKGAVEKRLKEVKERLERLEKVRSLLPQKEELEKKKEGLERLGREIAELSPVEKKLKDAEKRLEKAEKGLRVLEKKKEMERAAAELASLKAILKEKTSRLESLKSEVERLKGLEKNLEELGSRLERLEREREGLLVRKAGLESSKEHLLAELELLKRKEEELERLNEDLKRARNFATFFSAVLPRYLEEIERLETMIVRAELEAKFREYFKLLTQNDDWEVDLTENFSPRFLARISGRWEEIGSPSGGQRSCIALAYRLALSWVARAHQGLNVGFLMLDEPTDGFSSEQLARFKSLLERLEAEQVIMVSHHEELQSAADQIIRIENIGGISRVLPA